MKGIAVVSGGLDSVTMAHMLKKLKGHELHVVSFDYGQRHKTKELERAAWCANDLKSIHTVVELPIGQWLKGSALTDSSIEVPEGHYADASMAATVVPNRNAIMLSIAFGFAVAEQCDFVAAGMHAGDHPIYPDCRPEFTQAFEAMEKLATEGYSVEGGVKLLTPFVDIPKHEIVKIGAGINVPFKDTWSCYKGGQYHCARCGTCVERIEAFQLAEVEDPTTYEGSLVV